MIRFAIIRPPRPRDRVRVEPFRGVRAVREMQVFRGGRAPEIVRERLAALAQSLELRAPLGDQVILVGSGGGL
jgi:hypothetical protein